MQRILIVEPDPYTAQSLATALQSWRFATTTRSRGLSALNEARRNTYQLIISEVDLPILDGLSFCEQLRMEQIETPFIFLSQKSAVDDIVKGLAAGADDYLAKPFSFRELLARIEKLTFRPPRPVPKVINLSNLSIDTTSRTARIKNKVLKLRRREFEILAFMAEHDSRVFTRSQLNSRTSSNVIDADDSCIDVHISNIRKALKRLGAGELIQTVHGVGYRLNCAG